MPCRNRGLRWPHVRDGESGCEAQTSTSCERLPMARPTRDRREAEPRAASREPRTSRISDSARAPPAPAKIAPHETAPDAGGASRWRPTGFAALQAEPQVGQTIVLLTPPLAEGCWPARLGRSTTSGEHRLRNLKRNHGGLQLRSRCRKIASLKVVDGDVDPSRGIRSRRG